MILDDLDARPGSATSLLRTVVGLYARDLGGHLAAADLVALLGAAGVAPGAVRSAVSRAKGKGLLDAAEVGGRAGYRLAPGAAEMLARGDRRIFGYRPQGDDDPWCLVSFSIPESRRDARHQLRRHLAGIGCGTVATGLWISPGHLVDEVEGILEGLGLRDAATVFVAGPPRVAGPLADAVARWWDLDGLAARHHAFLVAHPDPDAGSGEETAARSPAEAFARWVRAVDDWRPLPYVDPGLPAAVLPPDWPGTAGVARFAALRAAFAGAAAAHVRAVVPTLGA
ncbi:PaaX family transcriptional regulator C-terminal domain-containing protein [Isoptericola sp. NPDC019482]|uniref:PaaX family transcriptional regulator n=1 Tax=Isoptericola sp. NPDC019482 TaxID=3154688 RepID=UPI00347981C3